jgi:predicted metal-dependent hydrolase
MGDTSGTAGTSDVGDTIGMCRGSRSREVTRSMGQSAQEPGGGGDAGAPTRPLRWCEEADEGVRLFNARHFFEAHDVFEEIWMGRVGDERLYFQGLIQIAVAFYKIEAANLGGARSLLGKGIDKLGRARHLSSPIDHDGLLEASRAVLERLERADRDRLRQLDPASLPRIDRTPAPGPSG